MDPSNENRSLNWRFLSRVLLKAAILFVAFNLLLVTLPIDVFGKFSLYNRLFPGRLRFPFGESPQNAYNLSLDNFNAMFSSHDVSAVHGREYRIFLLGDSSVWGTLLTPEQTLAGQINAENLATCDGRPIRAYNLGYPTLSLFKDLLVLAQAMQYQPDLVIWLVTLESFPNETQLDSPVVANNPQLVLELAEKYDLDLPVDGKDLQRQGFWDRTLFGRRRALADLVRLQAYGFMWAATGIDQYYPESYPPALRDLEADDTFHSWMPGAALEEKLGFELLDAGERIAGETPVWFINEPILVSQGMNSDIRYNYYYPRWAYDAYRSLLAEEMQNNGRVYLDVWNLITQNEFTNSAIHLTPEGSALLTSTLLEFLENRLCLQE